MFNLNILRMITLLFPHVFTSNSKFSSSPGQNSDKSAMACETVFRRFSRPLMLRMLEGGIVFKGSSRVDAYAESIIKTMGSKSSNLESHIHDEGDFNTSYHLRVNQLFLDDASEENMFFVQSVFSIGLKKRPKIFATLAYFNTFYCV